MGVVTYIGPNSPTAVTQANGTVVIVRYGIPTTLDDATCTGLLVTHSAWWLADDPHTAGLVPVQVLSVVTVTAPIVLQGGNSVVFANADSSGLFAVTLPDARTMIGKQFTLKNIGATVNVSVNTSSGNTIEGASTYTLTPGSAIVALSDGTATWRRLVTSTTSSATEPYVSVIDYGADMTGVADSSTALQNAVNAVGTQGTVFIPAGTLLLNTVSRVWGAALPRSAAGVRILGAGQGATTIKLSVNTYQFLMCPYVADYDTYQNIEVSDLSIDASAIPAVPAHGYSVVLGNLSGSANQGQRVNVSGIRVRRVKATGIPTRGTTPAYSGINFQAFHPGAAETQTSLTDIVLEDVSLNGGDAGILLQGQPGTGNTCNVFLDNIHWNRVTHDTGLVPGAGTAGLGNQIGGGGFGGNWYINKFKSINSGDVPLELDAPQYAVVEDSEFVDGKNSGLFVQNFNMPANVDAQLVIARNCRGRVSAVDGANVFGSGFLGPASSSQTFGTLVLDGCSFHSSCAHIVNLLALSVQGPLQRLEIKGDFKVTWESVNDPTNNTHVGIVILPTVSCHVSGGLRVAYSGAMTGTGNVFAALIAANASGQTLTLEQDRFVFNSTLTGIHVGHTFPLTLGGTAAWGNLVGALKGYVRNLRGIISGADTNPNVITVADPSTPLANNTLAGLLKFTDSDMSGFPGSNGLTLNGTSQSFVSLPDWSVLQTAPAPVGLTGLVTATGKLSGLPYAAVWRFAAASGTAITAIDYSTNGGTTYTNFLTQASGALPAGFSQSLGPLPRDALVKVTFTGTQPTITLVPSR